MRSISGVGCLLRTWLIKNRYVTSSETLINIPDIVENCVTFGVTLTPWNPKSLKLSMVRSKGLEPLRLLSTTTSRFHVYQFHHERIRFFSRGLWCFSESPKNDPLKYVSTFLWKIGIPIWCLRILTGFFDKHHFPSAFNSSPVLPPCLWRRSAVSLLSNKIEKSSDVLLSSFFAFTSVPLVISS